MNSIAIAVPARDMVHTHFAFDFASMIGHQVTHSPDKLIPMTDAGTLIQHMRQELADDAIRSGATHILWLDTDMRFPPDTLERLLAHDVDFVAANCSKRKEPVGPTAITKTEAGEYVHIWPDADKHGLEEIKIVGLAVALMRVSVFEKLERPFFNTPWHDETGMFVGEDTYFCTKLDQAGVRMFIDHDLSWEVGHIGGKTYGMPDCMMEERSFVHH